MSHHTVYVFNLSMTDQEVVSFGQIEQTLGVTGS
jgi:hypothetical protein